MYTCVCAHTYIHAFIITSPLPLLCTLVPFSCTLLPFSCTLLPFSCPHFHFHVPTSTSPPTPVPVTSAWRDELERMANVALSKAMGIPPPSRGGRSSRPGTSQFGDKPTHLKNLDDQQVSLFTDHLHIKTTCPKWLTPHTRTHARTHTHTSN